MSKTKLRCITCGKWFQSANAREVTCPDCTQKARKEKQAQKNAQSTATKPAGASTPIAAAPVRPPAPPKPKATSSGTIQWLDKVADVKIAQPDPPPTKPKVANPPVHKETTHGQRRDGYRAPNGTDAGDQRGPVRPPTAYRNGAGSTPTLAPRPQPPRQPMEGTGTGRPWQKNGDGTGGVGGADGMGSAGPHKGGLKPRGKPKAKAPTPPKPKKEKTPPPAPFAPTEEQIALVQERYRILAQPVEFDGIRTQISKELSIPKKAVKKIIKDFRSEEQIPSWWELQIYKGSSEELEKIKVVYQPYLPIPPVGVHKKIAETLDIKPGIVYQAIKAIRQEMDLPQYNDPNLHEAELKQEASKKQAGQVSDEVEPSPQPALTSGEVEPVTADVETVSAEPAATRPEAQEAQAPSEQSAPQEERATHE